MFLVPVAAMGFLGVEFLVLGASLVEGLSVGSVANILSSCFQDLFLQPSAFLNLAKNINSSMKPL